MLPSISASQIVTVNPAVISAGGDALALNAVVFTTSPPYAFKQYFSASEVLNDFGESSDAYKYAQVYFNGITDATKTPESLFISKYNTANVSARLVGATLKSMTLTQLKALSGSLSVSIDGVVKAAASISLSTATSFSDAAAKISTALSATVIFNTQIQAFEVRSTTTGATSTLDYATGTLAPLIGLTQATGALLDNVTTIDTATSAMTRVTGNTLDFSTISYTTEFTRTWWETMAQWVTAQNHRYWFPVYGKEATALIAGSTANFASWVKENAIADITPLYGTIQHAALAAGYAAGLDFTALNGRTTLDFRTQSGLAASVTDDNNAKALEANGYMFYGAYATAKERFVFFRNSVVSGDFKWADTYLNQVYFNSQLQLAQLSMLVATKSISYNTAGKSIVRAWCQDPIDEMLNFGGIQKNITLSSSQKIQINTIAGFDAATQVFSNGYALVIQDATAAIREARGSFPMSLFYTDGGSLHTINLTSYTVL